MCYINLDAYMFFKICHKFFRYFLAFYVAFRTYQPTPLQDATTDASQCPPRPTAETTTLNHEIYIQILT